MCVDYDEVKHNDNWTQSFCMHTVEGFYNTRITTLCKIVVCLHRFVLATNTVFYAKRPKISSCFIFVEFSHLLWIFKGISVLASKKDCHLWSCNKKRMERIQFFTFNSFLEGFAFLWFLGKLKIFFFGNFVDFVKG